MKERNLLGELSYSNYVPSYTGKVDLMPTLNKLDDLRAKSEALSGFVKPVNALDPDVEERNKIHKTYKDRLSNIATFQDPHEQLKATKKLAQEYSDDVTLGKLGAISSSHANYQNIIKEATDKLDKGEIDQIGYWKMVHQPYSKYKGVQDLGNGRYSTFSGNKVGKYSDIAKESSDFAQQWASSKGYDIDNDGRYINKRTHEYVDPNEVKKAVDTFIQSNPKYKEQLNHYKEYHGEKGTSELNNLINGISVPLAYREGFNKYDGDIKADPYGVLAYRKRLADQDEASSVGSSYVEGVNNFNNKDLISGVKLNNGTLESEGYKKIVNGKEVSIPKEEYDKEAVKYGYIPEVGTWTPSGSGQMAGMSQGRDMFEKQFKKVDSEKTDPSILYSTNKDIRDIVNRKAEKIYGTMPEKLSNKFIENTIKDYKVAITNNGKIGLLQRNNDAEQLKTKGSLLKQQAQSSTMIPLDNSARQLAKQEGGTLDYQQLTEGGWNIEKVESSGTIMGTGIQGVNVGDAATITLKKDKDVKVVRVLMRTPQEEIQNSNEANKVNEIATIEQSGHDGKIQLGLNLIANIQTDYTGGKVKQNIVYTDANNNPIPKEVLTDHGITYMTPQELKSHYEEILNKQLQKVGYGARGKTTAKTTELNTETLDFD